MTHTKHSRGFTLLEILLVVAAIGILAGIVILALNPSKQLGDTRNAQRKADVTTILNAVYQWSIDNNGQIPPGINVAASCGYTPAASQICNTTGGTPATCATSIPPALGAPASLVDLGVLFSTQKYLTAMPTDPSGTTTPGAGYFIIRSANNRITVCAPQAENGAVISVTR